jgi:low affinity Fe/Cu permease
LGLGSAEAFISMETYTGAIQAKLDELIRSADGENSFIGIERFTEAELKP